MTEDEIQELQGRRMTAGNEPRPDDMARQEHQAQYHRDALEKIRNGLATKVRILANHDSCPVCKAVEGAYAFDDAPPLPLEGCSHPHGCRCHYAPVLDRFGP